MIPAGSAAVLVVEGASHGQVFSFLTIGVLKVGGGGTVASVLSKPYEEGLTLSVLVHCNLDPQSNHSRIER